MGGTFGRSYMFFWAVCIETTGGRGFLGGIYGGFFGRVTGAGRGVFGLFCYFVQFHD